MATVDSTSTGESSTSTERSTFLSGDLTPLSVELSFVDDSEARNACPEEFGAKSIGVGSADCDSVLPVGVKAGCDVAFDEGEVDGDGDGDGTLAGEFESFDDGAAVVEGEFVLLGVDVRSDGEPGLFEGDWEDCSAEDGVGSAGDSSAGSVGDSAFSFEGEVSVLEEAEEEPTFGESNAACDGEDSIVGWEGWGSFDMGEDVAEGEELTSSLSEQGSTTGEGDEVGRDGDWTTFMKVSIGIVEVLEGSSLSGGRIARDPIFTVWTLRNLIDDRTFGVSTELKMGEPAGLIGDSKFISSLSVFEGVGVSSWGETWCSGLAGFNESDLTCERD